MPTSNISTQTMTSTSPGAPSRAGAAVQGVVPGPEEPRRSTETAQPPAKPIDTAASVGRLNDLMQQIRRELHFSVDNATGRTIIKVVNAQTQEVVRQIPPEEVVTLMEHLQQSGNSLMMDLKA